MSFPSFYSESLFLTAINSKQATSEWSSALNQISEHIKLAESAAQSQEEVLRDLEIAVGGGYFILLKRESDNVPRFFFIPEGTSVATSRPVIELGVLDRLVAYGKLGEWEEKVRALDNIKRQSLAEEMDAATSVYDLFKESLEKVKVNAFSGPHIDGLISKLKQLRQDAPADEESIKKKAGWFKRLAEVMWDSEILRHIIEQIRVQIPEIWSKLSFSQKLKVGAIAPLVGAGAYLGSIGVAGGGSAVGLPTVAVVLLLLMLNHSLVDFIDYLIRQLGGVKNQPDIDDVSKAFEKILDIVIKETFGKNHEPAKATRADDFMCEDGPRGYEVKAVDFAAQKYGGVGYVTQYTSDGGIDGYVVCEARREVLLIQAKCYSGKVGFQALTQYLGTFFYWKRSLEARFPYPISRMILICPNDYSIEAKKVADAFSQEITLEILSAQ